MIGNHPLLVGRNDEDFDAAVPARDAKGIGGIRIVVDRQSQPVEPLANTPADFRVVLADPGREDDAVNAAERCGERAEFTDSPPDEKFDGFLGVPARVSRRYQRVFPKKKLWPIFWPIFIWPKQP